MSRKHFVALAAAVAQIQDATERKRTAELVASVCAQCNPNFNWPRFMAACGAE